MFLASCSTSGRAASVLRRSRKRYLGSRRGLGESVFFMSRVSLSKMMCLSYQLSQTCATGLSRGVQTNGIHTGSWATWRKCSSSMGMGILAELVPHLALKGFFIPTGMPKSQVKQSSFNLHVLLL